MTENIRVYSCKNPQEARVSAGRKLSEILLTYKQKSIPVLLLLSGGSARKIPDEIGSNVLGTNLTVGVLDERYSKDPKINNFSQLMETRFYKYAKAVKSSFIDTRIQAGESQEELAMRFQQALKGWDNLYGYGKIIITQGIGPDGHTSGVLPFPENPKWFADNFCNPDVWVKAYDAKGKNPYPLRITTTLAFLEKVDFTVVFVCGKDKKKALKKVFNSDDLSGLNVLGTVPKRVAYPLRRRSAMQKDFDKKSDNEDIGLAETPARIIHKMKKVFLFTDVIF